jgi:hypothetical protein
MTLQRILGAAALTLVITAAYAATASDPAETSAAVASSPSGAATSTAALPAAGDGG